MPMIHNDTLDFLVQLKINNNREWFAENKAWYERAKVDFEELVKSIISIFPTIDPEVGLLDPKKCVFRIYRDIRFSADKTPYKTHLGAGFRSPRLHKSSGYYLHIDPDGSFLSCGHYMLDSAQLKKVRKGISDDFDYFKSIIDEPTFKKEIGDLIRDDDALKGIPKGFDADNEAAEYLRLKRFYVQRAIPYDIVTTDLLLPYVISTFDTMQPLSRFLNDVLLEDLL